MKNSKFFSEQIRLWRIGKGLSLRKASKKFGVSARTFSNWERGLIPSDRQKERLKEKRLEQGLTRTELAKHLGYSETILSSWERGVEISECEAEDICQFFGIEVYD